MLVAPSVLTANFNDLEKEIKSIQDADFIHLDIMDGHFVPNISFGPAIAKQIAKMSTIPMDIHLMVTNPYQWIDLFSFPNTTYLTIHVESKDVEKTIEKIKSNHVKVGLSVKPHTKLDVLLPYLDQASLVLVMTVEPGFGGQSFMHDQLEKVKELVKVRCERKLNFIIEVDGGINDQTIDLAKEAGVDMVVAGSYLFKMKDRKKGIELLK